MSWHLAVWGGRRETGGEASEEAAGKVTKVEKRYQRHLMFSVWDSRV